MHFLCKNVTIFEMHPVNRKGAPFNPPLLRLTPVIQLNYDQCWSLSGINNLFPGHYAILQQTLQKLT